MLQPLFIMSNATNGTNTAKHSNVPDYLVRSGACEMLEEIADPDVTGLGVCQDRLDPKPTLSAYKLLPSGRYFLPGLYHLQSFRHRCGVLLPVASRRPVRSD